jgi:hypothetical protein
MKDKEIAHERAGSIWLGRASSPIRRLESIHYSATKIGVADQLLTIQDICEREQSRDVPLPQGVADDLFALFDRASDADLRVDLKSSETYSTGAKCLLEFLGRREAEYRDNEERTKSTFI